MAAYTNIPLAGLSAGAIIDGTGSASLVPLLIKNGKNLSGVEVQVTGTAPSGFVLRNSAGVLQGALGFEVAGGAWAAQAQAGDTVLSAPGRILVQPAVSGSSGSGFVVRSGGNNYVLTVDDGTGVRMQQGSTISQFDSSGHTIQSTPLLMIRGTVQNTSGTQQTISASCTFSPTSGTGVFRFIDSAYTINQTGGANGTVTGVFINATETAVVGTHNLMDLQVGSTSMFAVDNKGGFQCASAALATNTTVGFPRLRTMAGTPTGAVADGCFVLDTTGHKIWMRDSGTWKGVVIA